HNNTVHQARVPRTSLATRLQPFFQKVSEQLKLLDPEGKSRLLVSDRLQGLPGFADEVGKHFSRISVLSADAVGGACLRYHEELKSSPDAVHFVTRLRPVEAATAQAPHIVVEEPTHFLNGHHARRLVDGLVIRRTQESNGNTVLEVVGRGARRTAEGSTVLGEIAFDSGHFSMRSTSSTDLLINGVPAQPVQRLHLGERIGLANSTATIELIRVQDGD
ncbi:MAG: hypothetical protein WBJ75_02365, partial [Pseudohongiellaceae bacterium]